MKNINTAGSTNLLGAGVFALVLSLLSLPGPAGAEKSRHRRQGRMSPIVLAVKRSAPTVVNISTLQARQSANPFSQYRNPLMGELFRNFFESRPRRRQEQSLGSGVIIRNDGYILTNQHVISQAEKIRVHISRNRIYAARIIGTDPINDLAVIKIKAAKPLPHLPMGRSDDLMVGETVIAIGNPFGLQHTVTTGVISAIGRSLSNRRNRRRNPSDFIQTDASINPGNSGGPLLNVFGELIGINTAIFNEAQGIGFAIPINRARRIVDDLIYFGKVRKAWVGIVLQDFKSRIASRLGFPQKQGAIAAQVFEGSPAYKGGIRRGDVLIKFGGMGINSRKDYLNELAGYTVGSEVAVGIWRKNKILRRKVRLSSVPVALANAITQKWLGIWVAPISEKNLRQYRINSQSGVIVTRVAKGGASDNIGIQSGDVIRQINGQPTRDIESFREMVVRAREFPRVQLLVSRNNQGYSVTLQP